MTPQCSIFTPSLAHLSPNHVKQALFDLTQEFLGYLRYEENVPFPKGELARSSIFYYITEQAGSDREAKQREFRKGRGKKKRGMDPVTLLGPDYKPWIQGLAKGCFS